LDLDSPRPMAAAVPVDAPLGRALLGAMPGERRVVPIENGPLVEILAVELSDAATISVETCHWLPRGLAVLPPGPDQSAAGTADRVTQVVARP